MTPKLCVTYYQSLDPLNLPNFLLGPCWVISKRKKRAYCTLVIFDLFQVDHHLSELLHPPAFNVWSWSLERKSSGWWQAGAAVGESLAYVTGVKVKKSRGETEGVRQKKE